MSDEERIDESGAVGPGSPAGAPRVGPEELDDEERRIVARLAELIVEVKEEARGRTHAGARLQSDVGLDSVAIIDLVIAAEDEFGVEIPDEDTGDLMDATLAELARRVRELAAPRGG